LFSTLRPAWRSCCGLPRAASWPGHVADADEIAVPDHFHLECAAALRRMELRGELTPADAQAALDQLLALRVRRVDTSPLLREAWSMRYNVTMADALYVVIARRLDVALVTGDLRLYPSAGAGRRRDDISVATASITDPLPRRPCVKG